jgi:ATP-dependent Lon protease
MKTPETFCIAQREQVHKRVQELSKRSEDIRSRLANVLKKLWIPERELTVVTNLDAFADLRTRFPNFVQVIDIFEANAMGLAKMGLPFESSPILLQGEPGLGKTLFVSELARLMELPFYEVSMATMTSSFALSGSNIQWAEGTVGFIASSLADSKTANPIFLIDEIDKVSRDVRYNPMAPFYSLLEPHSAKRFKDEALEIDLDASKVIWVATANDLESIPDPILSRMRIIEVQRPDAAQMKDVVMSIYSHYRKSKSFGEILDLEIADNTMELLLNKSPREARMAIDEGCLKAIRENRGALLPKDLPAGRKEKQRVGFL